MDALKRLLYSQFGTSASQDAETEFLFETNKVELGGYIDFFPSQSETEEMNQAFPNGYFHVREFVTITDAHRSASDLAAAMKDEPDFRLVEVSPTAGGAWVCGFSKKPKIKNFDSVAVDETVLNAFLSLGPKAQPTDTSIGILESSSIAELFQAAGMYSKAGFRLLEIRIKRAAQPGAYAFFALDKSNETADLVTEKKFNLEMVRLPLVGDYRRFF